MDKQYLKSYMDLVIKVKSNLARLRMSARRSLSRSARVFVYISLGPC